MGYIVGGRMVATITIRRLTTNLKLQAGIKLFAAAIARSKDWGGVTSKEAASWVRGEFTHPQALVLGAFDRQLLVGVCCTVPFGIVFPRLPADAQTQLLRAVHSHAGRKELDAMLHWGGLAVKKKYEGYGIGSMLADAAVKENQREFPQANVTLAQTRSLRAQHVAEKMHFQELTEVHNTIWLILCGPT